MPLASTLRMALLALLWGSGFLWIKLALDHGMSPLQITVARCALGAAVLLALALAARQRLPRDRRTWAHLLVAAFFCNALPFALFGIGEQTVDSGTAGVLNATTPLWALLLGLALGTDRPLSPARVAGLLLGFTGVLLIFAPWQRAGLMTGGALALLGAAVSYAVAFAYMGRHLTGRDAPLAVSAAQLLTATGWAAAGWATTGWAADARPAGAAGASGADPTALLAVAVLGIFGTGITFYLNYRLIADEGATSAATVGYLLPVVSIALGALFLDERVGTRVIAGMVVVLAGVALTRPRRAARPAGGEGVDLTAGDEGADLTAGDEGADLTPRRTTPPPRPEPVG
ncbi:DMT family transporter [Streptomyces caniscabiei]|uniref:DMT family transporter n=1 Tax=Streptomyces caniscabiei TaxID=2746961 RepID=UPI0038F6E972